MEKPVRVKTGELGRELINFFVESYLARTFIVLPMIKCVGIDNEAMEVRMK